MVFINLLNSILLQKLKQKAKQPNKLVKFKKLIRLNLESNINQIYHITYT